MDYLNYIKNIFQNSSDLISKKIKDIDIVFLESLCSSDKINEYILKVLVLAKNKHNLNNILVGPNTKQIAKKDITTYLLNGFTLVIGDEIYAIETKGELVRSITEPTTEPDLHGPKDSFNESIQTNLGLIKRRIKSPDLINLDMTIGKYSQTKVSILYINSICDKELVNKVKNKLTQINIDGILDAGNIKQLIGSEDISPFPTTQLTERPDKAAGDLLEGKIIILVDASPLAISLPAFLVDFINPSVDTYSKNININFVKILRFICLITTLFLPAIYIALINYNQGSIPIDLLVNFAMQRSSVPIPSIIECLVILILCAILRESDIRFPTNYGSSISIVGALVMGDAAVEAGIVSPIMIIVIAVTYITSMVFTDLEIINSFRHIRFLSLFLVSILGLFGLYTSIFFTLIHLCSLTSLGKPYTYPIAPYDKVYFNKTVIRTTKKKDKFRSALLAQKNIRKEGD
ncbi:MAG: spore germination protein [bacterium]|nr:spore germination protein [bacterium]